MDGLAEHWGNIRIVKNKILHSHSKAEMTNEQALAKNQKL
jgi:hypothetical protein